MFVITMYFEGPKEDWYCQLGHPGKIKNLLTYLLTETAGPLSTVGSVLSLAFGSSHIRLSCMVIYFITCELLIKG